MEAEWVEAIGTLVGAVGVGGVGGSLITLWATGRQARQARQADRDEQVLRELLETAVETKQLVWVANQKRAFPLGSDFSIIPDEDRDQIIPVLRRLAMLGRLPRDSIVRDRARRAVDLAEAACRESTSCEDVDKDAAAAIDELQEAIGYAFRNLE